MEKIAFIELGASYVNLNILNVSKDQFFFTIDSQSEAISLGLDLEKDFFLKKPQIENCVKILKSFKKICDTYEVTKTIAITSFSNQTKPKNLSSFFDEVLTTCGFKFKLLSEEEQTNALYTAVINSLDVPKAILVNVDVDNIQIVHYNRRNILSQTVLPFGPLTLLDTFPLSDYTKEEQMVQIEKYVRNQLDNLNIEPLNDEVQFVGTGTYFKDLAGLVKKYKKYPVDIISNYTLNLEDVGFVYEQMNDLELDKTKKIKGVSEIRADVFVNALFIIKNIIKYFDFNEIVISDASLQTGMLFNSIIPATEEKPISDCLGFSLSALSLYHDGKNAAHSEQVYNLSMLLFRQLRVLHKLPRGYIKILRAASYLHDSGERVDFTNHAKHSYYTVLNSNIYGLTHREQVLAAFVASLHGGGDVSLSEWVKYKDILNEEDVDATKKLGIILRIAEAFDRTKNNCLVDINCDVLGDSVIMKTVSNGDNSFEIKEALKVSKDFEKFFKKKLEIL